MTSPRPRAPPVTTLTLPSSEKVDRVGWRAAPVIGIEAGSSFFWGYSTVIESSVRAKEPAWAGSFLALLLA